MKPINANEARASLITIVDDEACVRESLRSLIRSEGYETKEYASAEDFLIWGWWDEPACLILDVRLPGMGGLELQRYLAEKQSNRPIVLISGHATENEQTWAMMRGAVAFLRKPFSDEIFLGAVRKSIARARAGFDLHREAPRHEVCPLCYESERVATIPERFIREHQSLYASTLELIKSLNHRWSEEEGLCHRCWRFYVALGRVVNFLRTPNAPSEANKENHSTAGIRHKA